MRKTLILVLLSCAFMFMGCFPEPDPDDNNNTGGGGGGPSMTTCYNSVNFEILNGLDEPATDADFVKIWMDADAYGANNFFVWKVDKVDGDYYYSGTDKAVEDKIPEKGYVIPRAIWSAGRSMGLDGYDPYKFSDEDPFFLGYVPKTPAMPWWDSKNGVTNDGQTCPGDTTLVNGRPKCLDKNLLDSQSPANLERGKEYLVRFMFGGNPNDTGNWIMFCYQGIFTYDWAEPSMKSGQQQTEVASAQAEFGTHDVLSREMREYLEDLAAFVKQANLKVSKIK